MLLVNKVTTDLSICITLCLKWIIPKWHLCVLWFLVNITVSLSCCGASAAWFGHWCKMLLNEPSWQKQVNDLGIFLTKYLIHQGHYKLQHLSIGLPLPPAAKDAAISNFPCRNPNRQDYTPSCCFLFSSHFLRQLQWSTLGSRAVLTTGKSLELPWFWDSSQIST